MKCPKCREGYPKGARFCPNCGFEAMKKRRSYLIFLILTPPFIALAAWLVVISVNEMNWLQVITRAGVISVWAWMAAYSYRWLRWAAPAESGEVCHSKVA